MYDFFIWKFLNSQGKKQLNLWEPFKLMYVFIYFLDLNIHK